MPGMPGRAVQTTIAFSQPPPPVFLSAVTPPRVDAPKEGFREEQEQTVGKRMEGRRWFEDEREVHAARRKILVSTLARYSAPPSCLSPNADPVQPSPSCDTGAI